MVAGLEDHEAGPVKGGRSVANTFIGYKIISISY